MKRWLIVGIFVTFFTGGCADAPASAERGDMAVADAAAGRDAAAANQAAPDPAVGEEVVWVDVRTPQEFAAGHVVGAINIPHTELAARHGELEPYADREIMVYCRTGRRSGIAQGILEREGFAHVTNAGGLREVQAQGVPVTR